MREKRQSSRWFVSSCCCSIGPPPLLLNSLTWLPNDRQSWSSLRRGTFCHAHCYYAPSRSWHAPGRGVSHEIHVTSTYVRDIVRDRSTRRAGVSGWLNRRVARGIGHIGDVPHRDAPVSVCPRPCGRARMCRWSSADSIHPRSLVTYATFAYRFFARIYEMRTKVEWNVATKRSPWYRRGSADRTSIGRVKSSAVLTPVLRNECQSAAKGDDRARSRALHVCMCARAHKHQWETRAGGSRCSRNWRARQVGCRDRVADRENSDFEATFFAVTFKVVRGDSRRESRARFFLRPGARIGGRLCTCDLIVCAATVYVTGSTHEAAPWIGSWFTRHADK